MVWQHVGAVREVLAAAEADFEVQAPVVTEEPLGGNLAFSRHLDLGQEPFDQVLLAFAQLVPA